MTCVHRISASPVARQGTCQAAKNPHCHGCATTNKEAHVLSPAHGPRASEIAAHARKKRAQVEEKRAHARKSLPMSEKLVPTMEKPVPILEKHMPDLTKKRARFDQNTCPKRDVFGNAF